MALEVARRLIDNVWRTVIADEAASPGGSLPDEWDVSTTAGDDKGSLEIQTDQPNARIILRNSADHNATIDLAVVDSGGGAVAATLQVEANGGGQGSFFVTDHDPDGESASLFGSGQLQLFTKVGVQGFQAWNADGSALEFALLDAGQPMIGVLAAPADGDLSAGQVALWFDATNGAAKLKIKGKSANGTVVVGEVALT